MSAQIARLVSAPRGFGLGEPKQTTLAISPRAAPPADRMIPVHG